MAVIPFRRPNWPIVLWAIVAAAVTFAVTMAFLNWQSRPQPTDIEIILRPSSSQSGQIEVIDGDTVRFQGAGS